MYIVNSIKTLNTKPETLPLKADSPQAENKLKTQMFKTCFFLMSYQ